MAQRGLRSPFRIARRFRLFGVTTASPLYPSGPIQQEENRQDARFPLAVNKRFDRRLPSR
jgi:hypothetical protein